jgi:hypothetical protein
MAGDVAGAEGGDHHRSHTVGVRAGACRCQIPLPRFVAGGTPLDGQQLERRQEVILASGRLHIHPPEDILLQKLHWYRKGGEV